MVSTYTIVGALLFVLVTLILRPLFGEANR